MYARNCILGLAAMMLPLLSVSPVQADVTVNEKHPFTIEVEIPCTRDFVRLTGTMHVVMSSTHNEAGGYTLTSLSEPQGVSGISRLGVSYRGVGVTRQTFSVMPPFPRELTFVSQYMIVGQGAGNDINVFMIMHYTVDANGEWHADVFDGWASCGSGG